MIILKRRFKKKIGKYVKKRLHNVMINGTIIDIDTINISIGTLLSSKKC